MKAKVLIANLRQTLMELNKGTVLAHAAEQPGQRGSEVRAHESYLLLELVLSIDVAAKKELTRRSVFTADRE